MQNTIAVIGLGYVGLGLATALSKAYTVYGYDISKQRIEELKQNLDKNELVDANELRNSPIHYTNAIETIKPANFFIVSVPTPANFYELPDLEPLIGATRAVASVLKKGDIVVYESTVSPGTTEEVCMPLLEEVSGLKNGVDFNLGYSPERINPHDHYHNLKNIVKVVSGQNAETLKQIESVYSHCCDTLFPVSTIKTAEAVKILENTQRDINIACMNEFAQIMHALDVNVHEVLEAAKTKWSFVPFKPGFVGGHCIAIDPLYLAYKAKRIGVPHDLILTARRVNDGMTHFVLSSLSNLMTKYPRANKKLPIGVFGITYKENSCDTRSSLALKFIKELKMAGFDCKVHDPLADKDYVAKKYNITLLPLEEMHSLAAMVIIVGHDFYREVGLNKLIEQCEKPVIVMDVPNLFVNEGAEHENIHYWNL
ncbi:MAG: nucleotide sugar dehydrogenase [Tatlockia sp.]|jgi:UDP-N-acetyl-D-galactosamine dehydrogenase